MPRLILAALIAVMPALLAAAQPAPESLGAAPDMPAVRVFQNRGIRPMPDARAFAAAVVLGTRIYLLGGYRGHGNPRVAETISFDTKTGQWDRHAPLPDELMRDVVVGGSAALHHGKILLGSASEASAETIEYDPYADAWSAGPRFGRRRGANGLFSIGDEVLAVSGVGPDNRDIPEMEKLTSGRWEDAGRTAASVARPSMAALAGKIYLVGGTRPQPGVDPRIADLRVYDPAEGGWRTLAPMPTARWGAAVAGLGGLIFAAGGDERLNGPALSTFEAYDPDTNSWTSLPPMPRPRAAAAAAAAGGKLYVFGGLTPELRGTVTVQIYDPRARSWIVVDPSADEAPSPAAPPVVRVSPVQAPARYERKAPERPQDYALVIGVGAYKRLPPAEFAEGDARDMAAALGALGVPEENIVSLTGPKATMSEISKYVEEWLPRRVSKDSRVYFYFSGHGAPDVKDGSAYLMPWDGDASFVKSTGFSLTRLYASLGELPARHVVAMIDSCFSGAGGRSVVEQGIRPLVNVQLPKKLPPRITVLAAAESEEIAGSLPERSHGLFSYYALQGLTGAADAEGKGHLTIADLYAYVRKHVILEARRQNREQTPTLTTPSPKLRLY